MIYSNPPKNIIKTNSNNIIKDNSNNTDSNLVIIKRGMPKLYEYNINQKYKKMSCSNFNEVLLKKLSKFYDTIKIPKVNIRKIKIKSQILFQISYNKENSAWIVSDSSKICVIFQELTEISTLYKEKKIGNNIRLICEECFHKFENVLKRKNSDDDFINIIRANTFLGFFMPDNEEIVFYSIVSNSQNDLEQFCLPISQVEDICFKFSLPYQKCITMKTDLVTFEQVEQELKLIYRRISEDYASFQYFGGIVLLENDNNIITGFKILNQEMKIIKKIQTIKFNLNKKLTTHKKGKSHNKSNNGENEKINQLMYEMSHYQLPRCIHAYLKLFSNIKIEDSLNTCLENLEEISKTINQNCNCNNEKNIINRYSINLLSCLISIDYIDNINNNNNNSKHENNNSQIPSLKSKTLNVHSKLNENNFNIFSLQNMNSTFIMQNCFMDKNQNIFSKKKTKKKVKFVDEVYNKNLVEEILIKSYKLYNKDNNFSTDKPTTGCSVFRNSICCTIF